MGRHARLIAVNPVELQGQPAAGAALKWFYGDLIGLEPVRKMPLPEPAHAKVLRFRSERVELRIALVEQPVIEPIACRAHLEVTSLDEVTAILEDRKYPHTLFRGVRVTDRALSLLDPAGNRVMLRRHWPTTLF